MKKILALIDADELLYKICYANQHTWYYVYPEKGLEEEEWVAKYKYKKQAVEYVGNDQEMEIRPVVEYSTEESVIKTLKAAYKTILKDTNAYYSRLFLTGDDNFRIKLATIQPYKGNRKQEKPHYYGFIRDLLLKEYFAEEIFGFEADDQLSMLQTYNNFIEEPITTIICTQDKDLDMVPGLRYNPSKRVTTDINPYNAMLSFYIQLLTGDSTDNILGLKGVGKVAAVKALRNAKEASESAFLEQVKLLYSKNTKSFPGLSIEEAITETGRLLWMQQFEGQLWNMENNYYAEYFN